MNAAIHSFFGGLWFVDRQIDEWISLMCHRNFKTELMKYDRLNGMWMVCRCSTQSASIVNQQFAPYMAMEITFEECRTSIHLKIRIYCRGRCLHYSLSILLVASTANSKNSDERIRPVIAATIHRWEGVWICFYFVFCGQQTFIYTGEYGICGNSQIIIGWFMHRFCGVWAGERWFVAWHVSSWINVLSSQCRWEKTSEDAKITFFVQFYLFRLWKKELEPAESMQQYKWKQMDFIFSFFFQFKRNLFFENAWDNWKLIWCWRFEPKE